MMIKADETLRKLLTIEKAVQEIVTLREGILELRESEVSSKETIDDLEKNEKWHRLLWRNFPQEVFVTDKDLVYILCSRVYASGIKRNPGEIVGKTDGDLYPGPLAEKTRSEDVKVLTTGQTRDAKETFMREGECLMFRKVRTPLKDEKGDIIEILGFSWE